MAKRAKKPGYDWYMATIKVHAVTKGTNRGTESCDFRGANKIGAEQGDHHKTVFEKEFGPSVTTNEDIEAVLADGPEWNRLTQRLMDGMKPAGPIGQLVDALGVNAFLRIGVWDE
jgi:hypothetical protein